jgi:hypothetical protein
LINAKNPCAETVFYMTWGRKNGDAGNCAALPELCTYFGMDSLLSLRYRMMAEDNNAILSPVGAVWKYIRLTFPNIELYQGDGSHPSVAGTYLAACCFYTALFRKDPTLITFNSGLSATFASTIRNAAKLVVYDSLMKWHIGEYDPKADFTYSFPGAKQIEFRNTSVNATTFEWNFGDGNASSSESPSHVYLNSGSYEVKLKATTCGLSDTTSQTINIAPPLGLNDENAMNDFILYPNPATTFIGIKQNVPNNFTYKITNISGQEIQVGLFNNSNHQIDISSFVEGIYFFQLFENSKSFGQQKFVKFSKL